MAKTLYINAKSRGRREGLAMVARCATALIGGYVAASGIASLLARLLPVAKVEATAWGMVLSFLFYALLALWAFHEARLGRVTAVIWGSAIVTILAVWLMGPRP